MTIPACLEKFKIGETVTVINSARSYDNGPLGTEYESHKWNADWADGMDRLVGQMLEIKDFYVTDIGIGVSCLDVSSQRRWNFPPWCLALEGETINISNREFEKSELDLIDKFVKYQAEEKKKKIISETAAKEIAFMDYVVSTTTSIFSAVENYWKNRVGNNTTSEKNRILTDQCKIIQNLLGVDTTRLNTIKDRASEVIRAIEVSGSNGKNLERDIKSEVLSILTKFVNSDIYQSVVPNSKLEDVVLRIITDPIILEHKKDSKVYKQDFGSMEIHFSMMAQTVKIIPQKPNYDEHSGSRFFHPHVANNGNVCEGAGKIPITNAIKDGRFTDLFDIIIGILENYNPGSPYCRLELWHPPKTKCSNCGDLHHDADLYKCHSCSAFLCSDCVKHCYYCGNYFCPSCTNFCNICNHFYCKESCKDTHFPCFECDKTICMRGQKAVKLFDDNGDVRLFHQSCCIKIEDVWTRKSLAFKCPDCIVTKVKVGNTEICGICGKEICRVCFSALHGHCKECNEKIIQEEIEAARIAEEQTTREEGLAETTEASPTEEISETTAEDRSEEQGEENVSTGN